MYLECNHTQKRLTCVLGSNQLSMAIEKKEETKMEQKKCIKMKMLFRLLRARTFLIYVVTAV